VSSVVSDLLALARALRAGLVTPAEAADRLFILAHHAHISTAQAEVSPMRDETSASSAADDGKRARGGK
jgi:hypothetical protein